MTGGKPGTPPAPENHGPVPGFPPDPLSCLPESNVVPVAPHDRGNLQAEPVRMSVEGAQGRRAPCGQRAHRAVLVTEETIPAAGGTAPNWPRLDA